MSKPKPINFRPNKIEDLILEKLDVVNGTDQNGVPYNKSDLVRYCIRIAGEHLFTEEEYNELIIYASRS